MARLAAPDRVAGPRKAVPDGLPARGRPGPVISVDRQKKVPSERGTQAALRDPRAALKADLGPRPGVLLQVQLPVAPMGLPQRPFHAAPTPRNDPPEPSGPMAAPDAPFRLLPARRRAGLLGVTEVQAEAAKACGPTLAAAWPLARPRPFPKARLASPRGAVRPPPVATSVAPKALNASAGPGTLLAPTEDPQDATDGPRPVPSADAPSGFALEALPLGAPTSPVQTRGEPRQVRDAVASPHLDHSVPEPRGVTDRLKAPLSATPAAPTPPQRSVSPSPRPARRAQLQVALPKRRVLEARAPIAYAAAARPLHMPRPSTRTTGVRAAGASATRPEGRPVRAPAGSPPPTPRLVRAGRGRLRFPDYCPIIPRFSSMEVSRQRPVWFGTLPADDMGGGRSRQTKLGASARSMGEGAGQRRLAKRVSERGVAT